MSVLPPPPRATPGGTQVLETHNTISRPSGPEYQLVVGEGTYVLRDDLHLSMPLLHPSEAPVYNANPLATNISPPTAGTKLSLAIVAPKQSSLRHLLHSETPNSATSTSQSQTDERDYEKPSAGSDAESWRKSNGMSDAMRPHLPVFGDGNPALAPTSGKTSKDASKRSKPKSNMVKSNSSFISRVIPNDSLTKRLHERNPEGIFAFANINRAFQWLDLSFYNKEDNLTKILFTKAHCLCHDVNQTTKSQSQIDVIMGFSTGDIIWYEPMSQKYTRLNKNGTICNSAVIEIRWLPNSDSLFVAAHMDGSLVFYDKEKEDAAFIPEEMNGHVEKPSEDGYRPKLHIKKSVQSKNQKTNPVAFWHVSNQRINGFSFSPDMKHIALVSEDGSLRVIDHHREMLLDLYTSYYGGMLCVCWSPDGRYILTGGQDDLVSIWSLADSGLVARCQGHNSWVTAVAFDPWRCDERNYRFGSVGEDCRLLLWDFSVGMLHRPRAASVRQRTSITSQFPISRHRTESSVSRLRSDSNLSAQSLTAEEIVHPVQSRTRTAILPPVMAKVVDDDPLCWLGFEEDCIITSCKDGHIRTWDRPKEITGGSDGTPSITGSS